MTTPKQKDTLEAAMLAQIQARAAGDTRAEIAAIERVLAFVAPLCREVKYLREKATTHEAELRILRARVMSQRIELARLNKAAVEYWKVLGERSGEKRPDKAFPVRTCKSCGANTTSTSTIDMCIKCGDDDGLRPKHFLTEGKDPSDATTKPCSYCWGGAKKIVGPDGPLPTTACPVCRGLFIEPPISPSGATCVLCGQPAGPSHANTLCGPLIRHRRRSHE